MATFKNTGDKEKPDYELQKKLCTQPDNRTEEEKQAGDTQEQPVKPAAKAKTGKTQGEQ